MGSLPITGRQDQSYTDWLRIFSLSREISCPGRGPPAAPQSRGQRSVVGPAQRSSVPECFASPGRRHPSGQRRRSPADAGGRRRGGRRRRRLRAGLAIGLRQTRLAQALLGPRPFPMAGQCAGSRGTSPSPHPDDMSGDPAGRPARPYQFERRKQPPAFVAPQNAAGDQLPGDRRGVQALAAEAAGHPQAATQLADLRHAMHRLSNRAAPDLGNLDRSEPGKNRADPARNGAGETLRPGRPGGFRRSPHQPAAIDDPEMIDAVAVDHRSLKRDRLGKALAERRGNRGVAPNRQQRFRQPPQRRAEMDVAGQHDVGGAQPCRRRDDALANPGPVDADDRRVLEDPRPCPPRQRGKAMEYLRPSIENAFG